jgi:hypothetical protein
VLAGGVGGEEEAGGEPDEEVVDDELPDVLDDDVLDEDGGALVDDGAVEGPAEADALALVTCDCEPLATAVTPAEADVPASLVAAPLLIEAAGCAASVAPGALRPTSWWRARALPVGAARIASAPVINTAEVAAMMRDGRPTIMCPPDTPGRTVEALKFSARTTSPGVVPADHKHGPARTATVRR